MAKSITPLNDATQRLLNSEFWGKRPDAQAVKDLLDAGADLEARDSLGCTALHNAASDGTAETVNAIINAGADIEARDKDGWTPLHWAASNSTVGIVNVLLEAGADIEARDIFGQTPYALARNNPKFRGTERLALLA